MIPRAIILMGPVTVASALFWGLAAWQASPHAGAPAPAVPMAQPVAMSFEAPLRNLPSTDSLSSQDTASGGPSPWRLLGVVRTVKGHGGLAVLGGPAGVVTLRLGARTEDGWSLTALRPDGADLRGPAGQALALSLPKPTDPMASAGER